MASGLREDEKVQDSVKYLVSLNHMVKMINIEIFSALPN